MNVKQTIWNYFLNKGFTPQGTAAIMGNIQKESLFIPNNLEDNRLPYTDQQYTQMVDNGTYTAFTSDSCGYGIVQWTYGPFKQDLLNLCKSRNKSISDLSCQLDLLYSHLQSEGLFNTIKNATSIEDATVYFMIKFEKPTDQSNKAKNERIEYAKAIFNEFNSQKGGNNRMKYNKNNPPLVCMQTNSTCYRNTGKMEIKGVLWHSTGANNTTIKRYVQPSDNDPNRATLLAKIGTNPNRNDWNHIEMQAGLNAWVGTLADGSVAAVQTMPWNYRPWGCGSGSKGSCNNGWIQFEICEDSLSSKNYFDKVYREACELTAYLCSIYNLNPIGKVSFNGASVPVILCHQDSYQLGLGSNHSDVYHWFNKYGKTMNDVRTDVAKLMGKTVSTTTTVAIPSVNSSLLRKGSEGEEVKKLQENLIKLGYNVGSWGADGDFGEATLEAVIKFQQNNGLEPDGIVGAMTQAMIQKQLKLKTAQKPVTPAATTKPAAASNTEIYRIRTEWNNVKSQVGAYKDLNNAIAACKKLSASYKVFNSAGKIMYENKTIASIAPKTISYTDVHIGSSSKDENGRYANGIPGDQTGKEVYILNWYDGGWIHVLRPKSSVIAEKIATACEQACLNNKIGYDQSSRNSLYIEAKKVNFDLSKITTPCSCDCASLVSICCIAAGLPENIFFAGGNMRTTNNMLAACEATGQFHNLTNNNYTREKDFLCRGDILLAAGHTVIVLSNGVKANMIAPTAVTIDAPTYLDKPYMVRVTVKALNIRKEPNKESKVVTIVKNGEAFTIIAEKGEWGKLKSGIGWVDLTYVQKV